MSPRLLFLLSADVRAPSRASDLLDAWAAAVPMPGRWRPRAARVDLPLAA